MITKTIRNNRCRKRATSVCLRETQVSTSNDAPFPLRLAREGDKVKIVGMNKSRGCHDRMAGIGLCIGSDVEIIRHFPCGKMIVGHNDTRLYIGGGMAHKIRVTVFQGG